MRFIFSTGSLWPYGMARCFAFAAKAGFDGMEIMIDQRWDTRHAGYLQEQISRYDLPIVAVHSPFWPSIPGWPDDPVGRLEESLKLAAAVGAEVVVHHLPLRVGHVTVMAGPRFFRLPLPWRDRAETRYLRWLGAGYAALQASTTIALCIENMPAFERLGRRWNLFHLNTTPEMMRFPNWTLDTTHLGTWGTEPAELLPLLDGRVRHVHLSNYDGREHRRPDQGHLRLDRFLRQLQDAGYEGAVSFELLPDALAAGSEDEEVVGTLRRTLTTCRSWLGEPTS